jgi:uncharacterized protein
MSGITELTQLLASMKPELSQDEFVFCSVKGALQAYVHLAPIATFIEAEGLTLVLTKSVASGAGLAFEQCFKRITLTVHSSLDAVGLTAAVATKLTSKGISANVMAAYYHDHIFVPSAKAQQALLALEELSAERT